MWLVVLWLVFSFAVAILASNKGRSGFLWFLLAVIISPLIAGIFCAVSKNLAMAPGVPAPSPLTHVKCPACAELVLAEASICRHCRTPLTPIMNHAQIVQAEARAENRNDIKNTAIGIAFIVCLVLLAKACSS